MGTGLWWRPSATDVALAVAIAALVVIDAAVSPIDHGPLDLVLVTAGALVLVWRGRYPRAVLFVSLVCALAYGARVEAGPVSAVPGLIGVYTIVAAGHRRLAVVVVVPLMVVAFAGNLAGAGAEAERTTAVAVQEAILPIGWFVAAAVLGEVARSRRAYLDQLHQRLAEAERASTETSRRVAAEERLRIARDLHDSLTHSISVIRLQAGVAVHLARKRGEEVPEALLAVDGAAKDAMRELRAALDVLRSPDADADLARLADLVERSSSAEQPVVLEVIGSRRPLPGGVERAAYRIVQEALTNASRHAGPTPVAVTLDFGGTELMVRVDDHGTATPGTATVPGIGLTGMEERVAELGGRLEAGARADGGFTVEAVVPVPLPDSVTGSGAESESESESA